MAISQFLFVKICHCVKIIFSSEFISRYVQYETEVTGVAPLPACAKVLMTQMTQM